MNIDIQKTGPRQGALTTSDETIAILNRPHADALNVRVPGTPTPAASLKRTRGGVRISLYGYKQQRSKRSGSGCCTAPGLEALLQKWGTSHFLPGRSLAEAATVIGRAIQKGAQADAGGREAAAAATTPAESGNTRAQVQKRSHGRTMASTNVGSADMASTATCRPAGYGRL